MPVTSEEVQPEACRTEGQRKLLADQRSLNQLARELGVSRSTVGHWRTGFRTPEREGRLRLEERLGIPAGAWGESPRSNVVEHTGGARDCIALLGVALFTSTSVLVACLSPGVAQAVGVIANVAALMAAIRLSSALTYRHSLAAQKKAPGHVHTPPIATGNSPQTASPNFPRPKFQTQRADGSTDQLRDGDTRSNASAPEGISFRRTRDW